MKNSTEALLFLCACSLITTQPLAFAPVSRNVKKSRNNHVLSLPISAPHQLVHHRKGIWTSRLWAVSTTDIAVGIPGTDIDDQSAQKIDDEAHSNYNNDDTQSSESKEPSYASILRVIDENHYDDATQSCPYLPKESPTPHTPTESVTDQVYYSPSSPILSQGAVEALRETAQRYFEAQRQDVDAKSNPGLEVADLGKIVSFSSENNLKDWESDLENALTQHIYPAVRSRWSNHEAFQSHAQSQSGNGPNNSISSQPSPSLVVSSATVVAGGGYPGAKVAMTTLERDAGLFVVHIDLGSVDVHGIENEDHNRNDDVSMGAIFMESLLDQESSSHSNAVANSVVGPLTPGQVVIHRSKERTAAFVVPSNFGTLTRGNDFNVGVNDGANNASDGSVIGGISLDCQSRRRILKAVETSRHMCLRLVLTTLDVTGMDVTNDKESSSIFPQAPAEERCYRVRNFARFRNDRIRYLTLAGLLDVDDYEVNLWMGFDYLSRLDDPNYRANFNGLDEAGGNAQFMLEKLSDINRAVFHLEKAASSESLGRCDPRVHFQLATALGAKMECEKSMNGYGNNRNDVASPYNQMGELAKIAYSLERSAQFESAAVKLGIHGIEDLTICLNALADTRCKMAQFDKALEVIDLWAECGSIRSFLAIEDRQESQEEPCNISDYEWIEANFKNGSSQKIAMRTKGDFPFLDSDDVDMLRSAADRHFARASGVQTSRYTMQYEGNTEAHLDDLCAGDAVLKTRIDHILQNRIYPLVRHAFSEAGESVPMGPLCVYDSIFVRYNGDVAKAAGRVGASQPLHQDGGIFSVNIALNSHKDDDSENGFSGGGTFFEALADGDYPSIQRPYSPGHALVHATTVRHAGAPTTSGIRDILVIFLTARRSIETAENTWRIERPMRLQSIAKQLPRDQLIPCLELAKINDPTNSEMSYWLGVHLIQGDMNDSSDERWNEICRGVEHLKMATILNPADARAHYHHGMGISSRHKYAMRTKRAHLLPPAEEAASILIDAFETAIRVEKKCAESGCKNGINLAAAYLALGDFMARLKDYDKAMSYLVQIEGIIAQDGDMDESWVASMMKEASSIMNYCKREASKMMETTST